MTGPQHYREAERIITHTAKTGATCDIAIAQVHATLALAAATAASQATSYDGDEDSARSRGWAGVA